MSTFKTSIAWVAASIGLMIIGGIGASTRSRVEMGTAAPRQGIMEGSFLASLEKDHKFTESEYFYMVSHLLTRDYVEPIQVDNKMALGAIKGMINSLLDPQSIFMNKKQFASFQHQLSGQVEGIGVELIYQFDQTELKKVQNQDRTVDSLLLLPQVVVSAVIPGSPADKAGIQVGDQITKVGDKFTISGQEIKRLREMQLLVTAKKASGAEFAKLRDELTLKIKSNIPPNRVREVLTLGSTGNLSISWLHSGKVIQKMVAKSSIQLPDLAKLDSGRYVLRILTDTPADLAKNPIPEGSTIDLRQSTGGNFATLMPVLEQLAPAGNYGTIQNERHTAPEPLTSINGKNLTKPYTLVVDSSVTGAAQVLALALVGTGHAKLEGALPARSVDWLDTHLLPEGGYTLCTGTYVAPGAKS